MAAQLEAQSNLDHKKKHKLGKDSDEFKAEYKTTRSVIGDLTPFGISKFLEETKTYTPEEHETIMRCYYEAKLNMKLYALGCSAAMLSFAYWQRTVLPRWFFFLAFTVGGLAGSTYGLVRSGFFLVEEIDKLGKDYEISRMMKQDVFDSRPDIDSGMRAQYYIHQQKQRNEFEKAQNRQ